MGFASAFETIGLFAGPHWALSDDETMVLTTTFDAAISTLEGDQYEFIKKVFDRYFPWLTLSIVAGKIIVPRINQTRTAKSTEAENFPSFIPNTPGTKTDPGPRQGGGGRTRSNIG